MKNKQVNFNDWGLIDYKLAWEKQEEIFAATVSRKIEIRNLEAAQPGSTAILKTPNHVVFCEHPHVYTLGKKR